MEARSTCSEPRNLPHVLGLTDTAHAVTMLTYTYADICAELQIHTGARTHTLTAGPSQLTPCHRTNHFESSGETEERLHKKSG